MNKKQAAHALGVPEREIVDVYDHDFGPVIKTHDGQETIIVPEDRPDAAGNTGIMWFRLPHENYRGIVPVFATFSEAGEPEGTTDEPEDEAEEAGDESGEQSAPKRRRGRQSDG